MSIIRRGTPVDRNFYVLDKSISEDSRLSWEARGLLIFLLGKPDDWSVSIEHLTGQAPAGKDKVGRILNELKTVGYVTCERRRGEGGKMAGYVYTVFEYAANSPSQVPQPENPDTVKNSPEPDLPDTGKPELEKPFPENPRLIRTEYKQELNTPNQQQQRVRDPFEPEPLQPYQPEQQKRFDEHWQPEQTTLQRIAMLGIPEDFIQASVPEFVAYWLTANRPPHGGNYETAFLKSVKRSWEIQQSTPRGHRHGSPAGQPDGTEFQDALQSTDWIKDVGKSIFDDIEPTPFDAPSNGAGCADGQQIDHRDHADFPQVAGALPHAAGSGWYPAGVAGDVGGTGRDE